MPRPLRQQTEGLPEKHSLLPGDVDGERLENPQRPRPGRASSAGRRPGGAA